jgi:hypothetical protein
MQQAFDALGRSRFEVAMQLGPIRPEAGPPMQMGDLA